MSEETSADVIMVEKQQANSNQEEVMLVETSDTADQSAAAPFTISEDIMASMFDAWDRKPDFYCKLCDIDCKSDAPYKKHLAGNKHKKNAEIEVKSSSCVKDQANVTPGQEWDKNGEGMGRLSEPAGNGNDPAPFAIPEDMMASMFSAWDRKKEFYCKICDVDCKSEGPYKSHIAGAKHKKKVETPSSTFHESNSQKNCKSKRNFQLSDKPLVGLEFVQEFYEKNNLSYICHLCDQRSLCDGKINDHLTSIGHRKNFFRAKHPDIWGKIAAAGITKEPENCNYYARFIEETHGRKEIVRAGEKMKEIIPEKPVKNDQKLSLHCDICDIVCTSKASLKIHISGAKHRNKKTQKNPVPVNLINATDRVEEILYLKDEPIIGLEYVEEFYFSDPTHSEMRYRCYLCDVDTLKCDSIVAHIISAKHRRRYMKLLYPDFHKRILAAGPKNQQQRGAALETSRLVEQSFGRKRIIRMAESLPHYIAKAESIIKDWKNEDSSFVKNKQPVEKNNGPVPVPSFSAMLSPGSATNSMSANTMYPQSNPNFNNPIPEVHLFHFGEYDKSQNSNERRKRSPDDRGRSPHEKRRYSPNDRRRYSPDYKRRYSPDYRRRYSPDHRRRYSPDDRRRYSPDDRRRYSPDRRRFSPDDRRRRSPVDRRRCSPELTREEMIRMKEDRDRLKAELDQLKGEKRGLEMNQISNFNTVTESKIIMPMGELFERRVMKTSPMIVNPSPSMPMLALHPPGPPPPIITGMAPQPIPSPSASGFPFGMIPPMGPPPKELPALEFPFENNEEKESIVPPLQSIEAFCDPAVKDRDPWTEALPLLKRFAEVMFSIKVSHLPSNSFTDIATNALRDAKFSWTFEIDSKGSHVNLTLIAEGIFLSNGKAPTSEVAQHQAFQIFVEKARSSDYLVLDEVGIVRSLRMFRSSVTAPPGSFRYDLQCKSRTVPRSRLPRCQFCAEPGHIEQFCTTKKLSFN